MPHSDEASSPLQGGEDPNRHSSARTAGRAMSAIIDTQAAPPDDRALARIAGGPAPAPVVRVIEPRRGWRGVGAAELWRARGVLGWLVRRDLKVRYAQTALGAAWAVFQPVAPMLVFTVVFGMLGRIPSDGAPYAVFALAGLVPWTYFASAVLGATNSLVANPELVTKVYFPRLAIPLAPLLGGLVDLAIGLAVLLAAMLAFGIAPRPESLVLVPLLALLLVCTAGGFGIWLAALNARFRDVKHVTPVLLQVMMYASPVVYPVSLIPERWRPLYALNPMAGLIEGMRAAVLGTPVADGRVLVVSTAVSLVLLATGVAHFRRTERLFADVV